MALFPARRLLWENFVFLYPFGNTVAKDLLKCLDRTDKDLQSLEDNKIKVLSLGCGDLRNVFYTVAENPRTRLVFDLNDASLTIIARNILLLYMVTCGQFDFNKREDLDILWNIWYNAEWDEATATKFLKSLLELLNGSWLPFVSISAEDKRTIISVWKRWIVFLFCSKIPETRQERRKFMIHFWSERVKAMGKVSEITESSFQKVVSSSSTQPILHVCEVDAWKKLPANVKNFEEETKRYFETGSTSCSLSPVCINPTFLNPENSKWWVHDALCPFLCYPPPSKSDLLSKKSLTDYCQAKLKHLIQAFGKRVGSNQVAISFFVGDAVNLCLYGLADETYDVIDCSNLADHVGMANLVPFVSGRLGRKSSRLVTESMTWAISSNTVEEYLVSCLGAPPSMYPLLYGVRLLENAFSFELPPPQAPSMYSPVVFLIWAPAEVNTIPFPRLNPGDGISEWIGSMKEKCISLEPDTSTRSYTPFTLALSLYGTSQRLEIGGSNFGRFLKENVSVPEVFLLTWNAAARWLSDGRVSRFSVTLPTHRKMVEALVVGTPVVRLILFPAECADFSAMQLAALILRRPGKGSAVIDNIDCVFLENHRNTATFSFLAPADIDLERYKAAIFVTETFLLSDLFQPEAFEKQTSPVQKPWIFRNSSEPLTKFLSAKSFMHVLNVKEGARCYEATLEVKCDGTPSGVELKFDCETPSQSSHRAVVTLSSPKKVAPFEMTFAWPVLTGSSTAKLQRKDKKIVLRFAKSLHEPWPQDYRSVQCGKPIDPDRLPPLEGLEKLGIHLSGQFTIRQMKEQEAGRMEWKGNPMLQLKETIKVLFARCFQEGIDRFAIRRPSSANQINNDWYIRAHPPVRKTPEGSLILLLTAIDHNLLEKLTDRGLINRKKSIDDFTALFEPMSDKPIASIFCDEEEQRLFDCMLRYNALKIRPSSAQEKYAPSNPHDAWVQTYVSPLYVNYQGRLDEAVELVKGKDAGDSCAFCRKIAANMKKCGRCRSIFYCSAECQKSHWAIHKKTCRNV